MPLVTEIPSDIDFPSSTDVVVIGGGIAGISAGLELSERGLSVLLLEKGLVACEQSGRNWGWVRRMGRDLRELPLSGVSLDLWRKMNMRVGSDTGFVECGIAYLCRDESELSLRRSWHESVAGQYGLSTRLLSSSEACSLTPHCNFRWSGGLFTPDDGRAEPTLAVPAMANALRRNGGKIFQNCAARSVERSGGSVSGVVTERGLVNSKIVILAGGIWSELFLGNMGIRLPQLTVINTVMRTGAVSADLVTYSGCDFAVRRRLDGGYTLAHPTDTYVDITYDSFRYLHDFRPVISSEWRHCRYGIGNFFGSLRSPRRWNPDDSSPFEETRIFDPPPDSRTCRTILSSLHEHVPVFRDVPIVESWGGGIDVVPDLVPVISGIDSCPGFFVMTGFSGHGFGLGPGAGRLMADLVTGSAPCVDPSPFRFDRF